MLKPKLPMPGKLPTPTRLWERGLHHLLPRVCSLCEQDLEGDEERDSRLCLACRNRLSGRSTLRCPQCALSHDAFAPCAMALHQPPAWDGAIAWVDYTYPVDGWVHALKFQSESSLAHGLGWGLASAVAGAPPAMLEVVLALDALIPVPLSASRLARRGFNQAQLIGQAMIRALKARHHMVRVPPLRMDLLKRVSDGPALSLLPAQERASLIHGAYEVVCPASPRKHEPLKGMALGLIDDVMTTGATLTEATQCLKQAGASKVIVMVAARTPA